MEDSDDCGMEQDIISMRLKLECRWRDRFYVEPHHMMKIGYELVMGGWFAGLISPRLSRRCTYLFNKCRMPIISINTLICVTI